jgi:hypothetical protein
MKKKLTTPLRILILAVVAAAVIQQMARPADQRTWHGRVFGLVPYDFRLPTLGRIKARYWNAEDRRLLTPTAFGAGWGINVRQVIRRLGAAVSAG